MFYLATFWLFLSSARPQGKRSEWMHLGMVGSFILALLSKEQAVTLPLTAMVYEHFYRGDRAGTTWQQKVSRYGSLWLLVPGLRFVSHSLLWGVCSGAVNAKRELV